MSCHGYNSFRVKFYQPVCALRLMVNRIDVADVNFGCEEWKRSSRLRLLCRARRFLGRQSDQTKHSRRNN